ncbi:MAG: GGDEF domain-containing protein [Clostridiales bacterium]|nr:GGDEF domain-containing protein [Clostridiales bacterium]
MEQRKKVAVFSPNIYEPMTHAIQEGISKAALELGIKVIFFVAFSDDFSNRMYEQYKNYDEGDIAAFELPDLNDFDGIIRIDLAYGPYAQKHLDERLSEVSIPIINVGGYDERYFNVVSDEIDSFYNIVDHLIDVHNCRDIYHLAGLKERNFTQTRIDAYRKALEDNDIPFDENKVYYGTLWHDCGDAALDYILADCEKNGKKYPDTIVCANDYSAVGLIDACHRRGIEVPGDFRVTGYDGLEEAYQGYPSLTTGAQPFFQSGYQGIYALKDMWNGEGVGENRLIPGELVCNQSCGCKSMSTYNIEDIRSLYIRRLDRVSDLAQSTTSLILSVSSARTMDECFSEITKYSAIDSGFTAMLLCLAPNWEEHRILPENFSELDEEMSVVAGFIGPDPVKHEKFRKKDLLPPDLLADPKPYYIFAIHHLQYYMGYLIVSPQNEAHESLFMKSWIVNLGSMIENWRIRHKLNLAVQRMENLYNRDMLTNLYNRHGYDMFFLQIFKECRKNRVPIGVMMIDMDDLKLVNDNYGHAEGDYSLCTIANGMRLAALNGEICLRTGGDEFVVLVKDYSEEKALLYTNALNDYINSRIEMDKKNYTFSVSIGTCIKLPPEGPDESAPDYDKKADEEAIRAFSEEYLKIADAKMYEIKKAHKAGRS